MGLYFEETLDRLTSVVGSLCLTPIAFILPGIFHLKLAATSTFSEIVDWFLIIFGKLILFVLLMLNTLIFEEINNNFN